jgi:hypothetical protein
MFDPEIAFAGSVSTGRTAPASLERTLACVTGLANLRDAIPFRAAR